MIVTPGRSFRPVVVRQYMGLSCYDACTAVCGRCVSASRRQLTGQHVMCVGLQQQSRLRPLRLNFDQRERERERTTATAVAAACSTISLCLRPTVTRYAMHVGPATQLLVTQRGCMLLVHYFCMSVCLRSCVCLESLLISLILLKWFNLLLLSCVQQ